METLTRSFKEILELCDVQGEALTQARDAAEAGNRAKSNFLASMSHELKTPLNVILGYAQLLKRADNLTEKQLEFLDVINKSGDHLLGVINHVLEMSKLDAGASMLTSLSFSPRDTLSYIESAFRVPIQNKRLWFRLFVPENLPEAIISDEGKVRQVLINLLGNALKFTDSGGITVTVSARYQVASGGSATNETLQLVVDVEDTGMGIDAAEFDKVFQNFEQTESGKRKHAGTGLGMAISRQFARMMGGDLVIVRSAPNVGSLFSFTMKADVCQSSANLSATSYQKNRDIDAGQKEWSATGNEGNNRYDVSPVALLTPQDLNVLSHNLVTGMREAVNRGDMKSFREYAELSAAAAPDVAAGLRHLADAYDYETLSQLLVGEEPHDV